MNQGIISLIFIDITSHTCIKRRIEGFNTMIFLILSKHQYNCIFEDELFYGKLVDPNLLEMSCPLDDTDQFAFLSHAYICE